MDVADERLLAVVDHLHRPARAQREHRAVDLHREILAPAERAADAAEVDSHHLLREAEAGGDLLAVDVQPLRGDVDVDPALAVRDREAGLRAEEGLILAAELVDALDRDLAHQLRVPVTDDDVAHDVLQIAGRTLPEFLSVPLSQSVVVAARPSILILLPINPPGRFMLHRSVEASLTNNVRGVVMLVVSDGNSTLTPSRILSPRAGTFHKTS